METREKAANLALFFFKEPFPRLQSYHSSHLHFSQASPEKSIPPPITTAGASPPALQARSRLSRNARPCTALADFLHLAFRSVFPA